MKPKMSTKIFSIVYAACIVSCILLSAYLVSDVWARYFTEDASTDGARVGKWDVKLTGIDVTSAFNGAIYKGDVEERSYCFTVENNSEVALNYSINISFEEALPEQVQIKLDDGEWKQCDGNKTDFSFGTSYTYSVGDPNRTHTLTIQVTYATGDIVHTFPELDNIPITISVEAEQID